MISLMGVPESEAFAVNDISRWVAEEPEDMGARDKLWVTADPSRTTPTHPLKAARSPEAVPEYGTDSCAERIATEIAFLMGVVTAQVELAVRHQERGVISQRIEGELRHGNELLSGLHPEYQTGRKGAVLGYDLASIRTVLNGYRGWPTGLTAFDCFTGGRDRGGGGGRPPPWLSRRPQFWPHGGTSRSTRHATN